MRKPSTNGYLSFHIHELRTMAAFANIANALPRFGIDIVVTTRKRHRSTMTYPRSWRKFRDISADR